MSKKGRGIKIWNKALKVSGYGESALDFQNISKINSRRQK